MIFQCFFENMDFCKNMGKIIKEECSSANYVCGFNFHYLDFWFEDFLGTIFWTNNGSNNIPNNIIYNIIYGVFVADLLSQGCQVLCKGQIHKTRTTPHGVDWTKNHLESGNSQRLATRKLHTIHSCCDLHPVGDAAKTCSDLLWSEATDPEPVYMFFQRHASSNPSF